MEYSIQIIWGKSISDSHKNEIRNNLKEALLLLKVLPCWYETIPKGNLVDRIFGTKKTYIIVNSHQVSTLTCSLNIPTTVKLKELIEQHRKGSKARAAAFSFTNMLAGFLIAIFPKCPVCWATYMSMFGFLGASKLQYSPTIFYILIALASANLLYTIIKSLKTKNYLPLCFQLLGYAIIFSNRNIFEIKGLVYFGLLFLILSSISLHFNFNQFKLTYKIKTT